MSMAYKCDVCGSFCEDQMDICPECYVKLKNLIDEQQKKRSSMDMGKNCTCSWCGKLYTKYSTPYGSNEICHWNGVTGEYVKDDVCPKCFDHFCKFVDLCKKEEQ